MTALGRYLVGVATVATATLLLSFVLPSQSGTGVRLALGIALLVQAPLGWWLVRALGTERFLLVGLALESTLFALVGVLMAFVVIEAVVLKATAHEVR